MTMESLQRLRSITKSNEVHERQTMIDEVRAIPSDARRFALMHALKWGYLNAALVLIEASSEEELQIPLSVSQNEEHLFSALKHHVMNRSEPASESLVTCLNCVISSTLWKRTYDAEFLEDLDLALSLGANIDAADHEGMTLLHSAAVTGSERIAAAALSRGADPHRPSGFGRPAAVHAHESDNTHLLVLLPDGKKPVDQELMGILLADPIVTPTEAVSIASSRRIHSMIGNLIGRLHQPGDCGLLDEAQNKASVIKRKPP
jgi:hypothetical protein